MSFKKEITGQEFIKFLLPSILVMILISTFSIVDGYFISKYVGENALASVNLILPLNSIIFAIGLMFAAGGGALASIKLGEKDNETASKYFSNLIFSSLSVGILISIIALIFRDHLLNFLGVNEALWQNAKTYSLYSIATFPFLILKVQFAVLLRAEGNPKASLVLSLFAGIGNMILDYIFIVILDMGVAGAGLGTMLGLILGIIFGFKYFLSDKSTFKFKICPIDFKFIKSTILNGSSEMLSELAIGFTALTFNLLSMKYAGADGVVAISVILYINLLVGNSYQGFAMGTAPLLSYHYGANNISTLKRVLNYAKNVLLTISPIAVISIFLAKTSLVSIFIKDTNTAYNLAIQGLSIFSFAFLLTGYNIFASAMYTALSNGKISALISFSKTFVIFLLAAILLPNIMGIMGVWLIMPIVEIITASIVFYLTREKQLEKFTKINFREMIKIKI